MSLLSTCEFQVLRSAQGEDAFFACMGRFFASPTVRRECGGYPLNDGPLFHWFVARQRSDNGVLGFISVEQTRAGVRIREGYVRPKARGQGLFRELRQRVLAHADALRVECRACVPEACVPFLVPCGFRVLSRRGRWVTLVRTAHE
jgi:GNAT superfamily N-acetyltransferase